MIKLPKIVLILEPDQSQTKIYEGILEASGFLVRLANDGEEFFKLCSKIIPDIIVLNSTHDNVNEEKICKQLRKHKTFKHLPIVLLVEKMGFNAQSKAKQLEVELEEFPLKGNKFLQLMKKLSKNFVIPELHLKNDNQVNSKVHVELKELSELSISFVAPLKLEQNHTLKLKGSFLNELGIVTENFRTSAKGALQESKQYRNELLLTGISSEVLRKIKKYLASNRDKK